MAKGNEISTSQSVQSLSCVQHFVTPWTAARQASLSITKPRACSNSCPFSQWCHSTISSSVPPFSSCPKSFLASDSFPNEFAFLSVWPKYWSYSFSISPSNEYSGLISFRMDWLDLLAVQGTLKSLLRQTTNLKNIQATPTAQLQKNKWPNQKMGQRSK